MQRRWRIHLADVEPRSGEQIDLPAEEAHYVRRVLRLRSGERLSLFNGVGGEWWARLTRSGPDGVSLRIAEPIDDPVEAAFEVSLFQGWCEPARLEWVLQKGTELGLTAIHPLGAGSSGGAPSVRRVRRWRKIAVEACKQCGRRRLPRIEPLDAFPEPPTDGTLPLLLDPGPQSSPLAARLSGPPPSRLWLAAGPATGLGEPEVSRLAEAGWKRVTLGPRTLRSETAGLVAVAIALHVWGDLGNAAGPAV